MMDQLGQQEGLYQQQDLEEVQQEVKQQDYFLVVILLQLFHQRQKNIMVQLGLLEDQ
jgi:hypothetical protein